MGSPIPESFSDTVTFTAEMVCLIVEGNYPTVEQQALVIAEDYPVDELAFYLQTAWVMAAAFAARHKGRIREVMQDYADRSISQAQFMADVLGGIDDLPGDPQGDVFHP